MEKRLVPYRAELALLPTSMHAKSSLTGFPDGLMKEILMVPQVRGAEAMPQSNAIGFSNSVMGCEAKTRLKRPALSR
jgi:hypothetical protein